MSEKTYTPCFYCRSAGQGWTIQGLKYALDTDRLCDRHKAMAEQRIKDEPQEKEVLRIPASFLPPIVTRPFRNYQDREANNGELIE